MNIMPAHERRFYGYRTRWRSNLEAKTADAVLNGPCGLNIRPVRHARRDDLRLRRFDDLPGVGIIEIDHRAPVRRKSGKQAELGLEIGVHGPVKIEVVLGQVRERGGRERASKGPPEFKRVRGDLNDAVGRAEADHFRKEPLKVKRFRCGVRRRVHFVSHAVVDSAD